jgi:hypothetical protein
VSSQRSLNPCEAVATPRGVTRSAKLIANHWTDVSVAADDAALTTPRPRWTLPFVGASAGFRMISRGMSQTAELRCRCGQVEGTVSNASPESVNRVICYCDDCQAFLHRINQSELLDAHGGTDLVQVAPADLRFHRGNDRIVGLRLSPKGLYRWYSSCCNTPLGNTVSPAIPFVGIVARTFEHGERGPDDYFGKPLGGILGKFAIGTAPPGSTSLNWSLLFRALRKVLGWRLGGKAWPHPFFVRETGAPAYPVTTLSSVERDALRPLCGPHPASASHA